MSVAVPRVDRLKTIYAAANGLNFGFRMSDYPNAPFRNGIADFRPQLQRLTLRFCKKSESCVGMRNFVEHALVKFAVENPTCAIYVMPARNCTPVLRAEYSNSRMVHLNAKNMSLEQVHLHVNNLRTRSGIPVVMYESAQTAQCKSVQGMWSPIMFRNTRQNAHAGALPRPEFSSPRVLQPSAQEYVERHAQRASI